MVGFFHHDHDHERGVLVPILPCVSAHRRLQRDQSQPRQHLCEESSSKIGGQSIDMRIRAAEVVAAAVDASEAMWGGGLRDQCQRRTRLGGGPFSLWRR
jgi:hypothetical protein